MRAGLGASKVCIFVSSVTLSRLFVKAFSRYCTRCVQLFSCCKSCSLSVFWRSNSSFKLIISSVHNCLLLFTSFLFCTVLAVLLRQKFLSFPPLKLFYLGFEKALKVQFFYKLWFLIYPKF